MTSRLRLFGLLATFGLSLFLPVTLPAAQPTAEQLSRVEKFVEAGKYEEARLLTITLLEFYPKDPELTKILELLTAKTTPKPPSKTDPRPTPTPPPAKTSALSPEDRVEINTVLAGFEAAMRAPSHTQRNEALAALLERHVPLGIQPSPEWIPFWSTRAIAAYELDDVTHGWPATFALKQLGAMESTDPKMSQLIASLNLKGWLNLDRNSYLEVSKTNTEIQQRKQMWGGVWSAKNAVGNSESNSYSLEIMELPKPAFKSWSKSNNSIVGLWSVLIPGRTTRVFYIGPQHTSKDYGENTVLTSLFDPEYKKLTLKYRNDTTPVVETRSFEMQSTPQGYVVKDAEATYYKAK